MENLLSQIEGWAAEYAQISGHPVPSGFVRFVASRLTETGLIPDAKDWVTIHRDGKKERVRITGQKGRVVTYEREDGSGCATTVDVMKRWSKGPSLAAAIDYSHQGESGPMNEAVQKLVEQLGAESGTGRVSLDSIDPDD